MSFRLTILLCCLWSLIPARTVHAQFVQPGICEMYCHCSREEAVADCNRQDRLRGVPTNIPRGITKLYVQDGDFPSPSLLTRANMTGLEQVEYLRIIYCNLQAIESKAFLGMTSLKHLDLSRNALRHLDMYTFFGLKLINLYLQEQHNLTELGLQIAEDAFNGLTAEQINLRGNRLSAVQYSMFSKVNSLHRLILSDNRITHIDDGFSKHFNGQSYLLDLTSNPLECGCHLAWIASFSAEWATNLTGLNMTCIYYHPFQSANNRDHSLLELRRLTADQLCPRSRIQHIEVDVIETATRVILDCTAVSIPRTPHSIDTDGGRLYVPSLLSRTPPEVAWQYVEGGHLREVRRLPTEDRVSPGVPLIFNGSSFGYASSTVRLNVSLREEARQFKCTTYNSYKDSEEIVVTIRGPPKLVKDDDVSRMHDILKPDYLGDATKEIFSEERPRIQRTELTFTEPHYLLQPQFSLVQLALAVGGTFLSTLILLFVGARCLSACHRHAMLHVSSSASSINSPDAKVLYQAGTISRNDPRKQSSSPTQNGLNGSLKDNNNSLTIQQQQQQNFPHSYPAHFLFPAMDSRISLSPQFAHLSGVPNHFFQPTLLPPNLPSSSSGTDDLQSSIAQLISSPLIAPNSTLRSVLTKDGHFSPCLANTRPGQPHLTYWPVAPGSPSSVAGSHEYDVPRLVERPAYPMGASVSTINRSGVLTSSAVNCDFRTNGPSSNAL